MWHPGTFGLAIGSSVAFGLVGVILMVFGFKLFDWFTPKIDFERELAERQNIAVAIVAGAIIIGVAIVVAAIVGA